MSQLINPTPETPEEAAALQELLDRLPLRDDLRGKSAYGAPHIDVAVQLNTNENTHPVPADVQEAVVQYAANARRPPRAATPIVSLWNCARRRATYLGHDLTKEQIWAANGYQSKCSNRSWFRAVLVKVPQFASHVIHVSDSAPTGPTTSTSRLRVRRIQPEAEHAAEQVRLHRLHIVRLCSPNNPTGTALGPDVVEAVRGQRESNSIVVVMKPTKSLRWPAPNPP